MFPQKPSGSFLDIYYSLRISKPLNSYRLEIQKELKKSVKKHETVTEYSRGVNYLITNNIFDEKR